ncbi:plasmid recombination enzyme [Necator americanus]|uniref:Plasmid recombination enzyme n=1 Tax=Necator americanus TaxID=51031 RepID=W2TF55_NECAM|nr:plasmid recombination enzyme [Necator americanus]ETN80463.1 plasmid recombination enzyme [Necator americanus]
MKQVINVLKLKTEGEILKIANHNLRQVPSRNVVSSRTKQNTYYIGSSTTNVLKEMEDRLATVPKFRKDAVKVVNLVLSGSHEFFTDKKKAKEWELATQKWVEDTFGKENIIYSVVHHDEKTPHFQVSFVPIYDGKLRAAHWFDGPAKMNKIHNSYAKVNKPFGLQRGDKFKKPTQEELTEYYKKVNASSDYEAKLDRKLEGLFDKLDNPTLKQRLNPWGLIDGVVKPLMNQLAKNLSHYRTRSKEAEKNKKKLEQAEQQIEDYKLKMESLGLGENPSFMQCESIRKHWDFVEERYRASLNDGVIKTYQPISTEPTPSVKPPKPKF